jgi:hypothetical protein
MNPCSKDNKEEPPIYPTSRLYLLCFLAATNLCNILLVMHALLFHSRGRLGYLISLTLLVTVIVLLSTAPNSTKELY